MRLVVLLASTSRAKVRLAWWDAQKPWPDTDKPTMVTLRPLALMPALQAVGVRE